MLHPPALRTHIYGVPTYRIIRLYEFLNLRPLLNPNNGNSRLCCVYVCMGDACVCFRASTQTKNANNTRADVDSRRRSREIAPNYSISPQTHLRALHVFT